MVRLSTKTIDTIDEIDSIEFGVDSRSEMPFLTRSWLLSWCKHYLGENDSIRIIVASDCEQIVGIAPLCIQRVLGKGNVLRFLANGEVCSDYQTFPCLSSHRNVVVPALAREIYASIDDWDRIELDGVRADDHMVAAVMNALELQGCFIKSRGIANCWRLSLPTTMDEYLAQKSKNHRKNVRRKLRLFDNGSIEVAEVTDRASLEQGYEVLRTLHQRRRNSLGDPGCFASKKFDRFLFAAASSLLNEGRLRLFWILESGEPIAADIAILTDEGVFAYQSGISPQHLDAEPGRLANLWHIKRAIEDGRQFVDFLRGDEPYKKLLHASPIPCVKYEAVPHKLKSQACQAIIDVGRNVKSIWSGSGIA